MCVICFFILPFSSHITGPIGGPAEELCTSNTSSTPPSSESVFSSGSGGGALSGGNSTQFCGLEYEIGVNEDSVARIPLRVWAMLLAVMALLVISR